MNRVNLLPEETRTGLAARFIRWVDHSFYQVLGGTVGLLLAAGVISWGFYGWVDHRQTAQIADLQKNVEALRIENENVSSYVTQLAEVQGALKQQSSMLGAKLDYLEKVRSQSRVGASVFKDLRRHMPEGVWLTDLHLSADRKLKVAGGSRSEKQVSQFMAALKVLPYFSDVSFSFTEKSKIGQTQIVRFEIVCRVT